MGIHLVNPSDLTFGTSVITPRWPYVLAAASPGIYGTPSITDEALKRLDLDEIHERDVVGISIHTLNAARGYEIGREARRRGAWVVFGGVHASLYPDEPIEHGFAHSVVTGDGDRVWSDVLAHCADGNPRPRYHGGRIDGVAMATARWDLLPRDKYLWGAVQTVRGCPKHCSFCSVWRTDGQTPRLIPGPTVVQEIVALRRLGFRSILLSDDNFYPVTFTDLAMARRRQEPRHLEALQRVRAERFALMDHLAKLPDDLMLFTQITMEAAEDSEFLDAMRRARIRGVLVGVESISADGLKNVYKGFNSAGEDLVQRLRVFRKHRIHVVGSFIFGLPSDRPETFEATTDIAQRADLVAAQFVILTPFPGTLDFQQWEKRVEGRTVEGVPMNRYWLTRAPRRMSLDVPNELMTRAEISEGTQRAWDRFYSWRPVWHRSRHLSTLRERIGFVVFSKMYRQMYAKTGFAADSARRARAAVWARGLSTLAQRIFKAPPMPDLVAPSHSPLSYEAARTDRDV